MFKIIVAPEKNCLEIIGDSESRLRGENFTIAISCPDRKRFKENRFIFDNCALNVEYFIKAFPDAIWEGEAAIIKENFYKRKKLEINNEENKKEEYKLENCDFIFKTKPFDHQLKAFMVSRDLEEYALLFEQRCGKLLIKETPVLTPKGFKNIEDIEIGDEVCGWKEKSKVTNKFFNPKAKIYEITFSDKTKIQCCEDHLWWVKDWNQCGKKNWEVLNTKQILEKGLFKKDKITKRWEIPVCKPISFEEQELRIKPYTLGALIGDGGLTGDQVLLTTEDDIILENIKKEGYKINKSPSSKITYHILIDKKDIPQELLGYSYEKRIPQEYLFNSAENRIKLLQGLIDTDGFVDKHFYSAKYQNKNKEKFSPSLKYCTTSKKLFEDIKFLVQSLGGVISNVDIRKGKIKEIEHRIRYIFTIQLPLEILKKSCTVERKINRIIENSVKNKRKPKRKIIDIKYVGEKEGYCLEVDGKDASYLINDCIVTHNTKVILDTAAYLYQKDKIDTLVVVAPNGVHRDWINEAIPQHMIENSDCFIWNGKWTKKEQENLEKVLNSNKLKTFSFNIDCFVSEKQQNLLEKILKEQRCLLVIDESHKIKNPSAKRTKFLLSISKMAHYRRILSGTPIANGPQDIFSQFMFLNPQILGLTSFYAFKMRYCVLGGYLGKQIIGSKNLDELQKKIEQYSFRVLKSECFDLPPKIYQKIRFDLTTEQRKIYNEIKEEGLAFLKNNDLKDPLIFNEAITRITKLQQVISGFIFDTDNKKMIKLIDDDKNPKLLELKELLEKIEGKTIIWTKFVFDADILCNFLKNQCVRYDGQVDPNQRQLNKKRFKEDDKIKYIIINSQVGAEGITLPEAENAIFFTNGYSFLNRDQAEARNHDVNSKKAVTYFDMCCNNSIDSKIIRVLKDKKKFSEIMLKDPIAMLEGEE